MIVYRKMALALALALTLVAAGAQLSAAQQTTNTPQAPATEPAATQPTDTQPAAPQPAATQPAAPQPAATQPAPAKPAASADPSVYYSPAMPERVKQAIAKSFEKPKTAAVTQKVVDPNKPAGFLGIPGAPAMDYSVYIWGLLWAIWVGWIFSTVGAFGGIMAGVGHITIFGLGNYASSYGKGHPVNNLVTDSIRVSNQWLVGLSAIISSFNYFKMGRLVAPLGMCLAIGGVGGSWLVPELTAGQVSLKAYIGYFGLCVLLLGIILLREVTPSGMAKRKKAKEAAAAFEKQSREGGSTEDKGVKVLQGSWPLMSLALALVVASALYVNLIHDPVWVAYIMALVGWAITFFVGDIRFTFFGVEFKFKAFIPMLGGIVIAALASFLGVGGGFLYVPFLTSVAGLPMFLVAGTSALAVLVGMIVSIFSFMFGKAVVIEWGLVGAELIGIFLGSMIGPRTSKYISDKWLKVIFIILAFYVGLRYTMKGLPTIMKSFGVDIPPDINFLPPL